MIKSSFFECNGTIINIERIITIKDCGDKNVINVNVLTSGWINLELPKEEYEKLKKILTVD